MKLKNKLLFIIAPCLLQACYQPLTDNLEQPDEDQLIEIAAHVKSPIWKTTRSGEETSLITYPVYYYLINDADSICQEILCQESAIADAPSFKVPLGSYTLLCIAGMDSQAIGQGDDYNPQALLVEDITNGELSIGIEHFDVKNYKGNETFDITLSHCFSKLNVDIESVPTSVTSIVMQFSPTYYNLQLDGHYAKADSTQSVALQKGEDNHWILPTTYVYPYSVSDDGMSIQLTVIDGNKKLIITPKTTFTIKAGYDHSLTSQFNVYTIYDGGTTANPWTQDTTSIDLSSGTVEYGNQDSTDSTQTETDKENSSNSTTDATTNNTLQPGQQYLNTTAYVLSATDNGDGSTDLVLVDMNVLKTGTTVYTSGTITDKLSNVTTTKDIDNSECRSISDTEYLALIELFDKEKLISLMKENSTTASGIISKSSIFCAKIYKGDLINYDINGVKIETLTVRTANDIIIPVITTTVTTAK